MGNCCGQTPREKYPLDAPDASVQYMDGWTGGRLGFKYFHSRNWVWRCRFNEPELTARLVDFGVPLRTSMDYAEKLNAKAGELWCYLAQRAVAVLIPIVLLAIWMPIFMTLNFTPVHLGPQAWDELLRWFIASLCGVCIVAVGFVIVTVMQNKQVDRELKELTEELNASAGRKVVMYIKVRLYDQFSDSNNRLISVLFRVGKWNTLTDGTKVYGGRMLGLGSLDLRLDQRLPVVQAVDPAAIGVMRVVAPGTGTVATPVHPSAPSAVQSQGAGEGKPSDVRQPAASAKRRPVTFARHRSRLVPRSRYQTVLRKSMLRKKQIRC